MSDYGEKAPPPERARVVYGPAQTLRLQRPGRQSQLGAETDQARVNPFEVLERVTELRPAERTVDLMQGMVLGVTTTPTTLAANQNDYEPTGWFTSSYVRLDASAAVSISGFKNNGTARVVFVAHIGAANNITFVHENAGSAAANRFNLKGAVNFTLTPGTLVMLVYDTVSSRWRLVGA
jgi:hypothetical protein